MNDHRDPTDSPAGLAYADPTYAASLQEFGTPQQLERSLGWILSRPIPGTRDIDAMGCYPLFACQNWAGLGADLEALPGDHLSLTLVTDPFCGMPRETLTEVFDVVRPFKNHYVMDLSLRPETTVARHQRKSARKALQRLTIARCDPQDHLDTWRRLYCDIIRKHEVSDIRAFSNSSFAVQVTLDGLIAFSASLDGEIVGMHWYLTTGDVVYAHLAALHPAAYRTHASQGLFWTAAEFFHERYRWLDFGGGAGATADEDDGLSQFKAAWASERVPTYLCGKVFDHDRYAALATRTGAIDASYFPAYRIGEFGKERPSD